MTSIPALCAQEPSGLDETEPLVVHFEKNQTRLGKDDISRVRALWRKAALGDKGRVFVVGYADTSGNPSHNEKLALKRAQAVRNSLMRDFGLGPEKVIAIGQGDRHPVADNHAKDGRAKNRRVEIYVADTTRPSTPPRPVLSGQSLTAINAHLDQARDLVRRDQWDGALDHLQQARSMGAENLSDWHALYGIIGFFRGAPLPKVRQHQTKALKHDPHKANARDFLSRVQARENVFAGRITAKMGNSVQTAITVSAMAQQYEYLSLFGAAPRYHHHLDHLPVDVWECLNLQGEPVVYYFDHSNIHAWALSSDNGASSDDLSRSRTESTPSVQAAANETLVQPAMPVRVVSAPMSTPDTIWESKLFR